MSDTTDKPDNTFNLTKASMGTDLLTRLDSEGATGLDMSPGDPLCREAAAEIRRLEKANASLLRDLDRVCCHGKCLKDAKINVKGIAHSLKMDMAESFRTACESFCKIQHKREAQVFESGDKHQFLCLCYDDRSDGQCFLKILKPYVSRSGDSALFGWTDGEGSYVSNKHNPIHPDGHEKVVAFRKM